MSHWIIILDEIDCLETSFTAFRTQVNAARPIIDDTNNESTEADALRTEVHSISEAFEAGSFNTNLCAYVQAKTAALANLINQC